MQNFQTQDQQAINIIALGLSLDAAALSANANLPSGIRAVVYRDGSAVDVDAIVRKYVTGFKTLAELCDAAGHYRPTIRCTRQTNKGATPKALRELAILADAYDAMQIERGDDRQAYRG